MVAAVLQGTQLTGLLCILPSPVSFVSRRILL